MPNTPVRRAHALAGGVFVAVGMELAKRLLALVPGQVPTYSVVYGAFATVPILLIWIYIAWVIVLLGAVIAAYLPSLVAGDAAARGGHGWQFQLALEVLTHLNGARASAPPRPERRNWRARVRSTCCSSSRCCRRWCSWTGSAG